MNTQCWRIFVWCIVIAMSQISKFDNGPVAGEVRVAKEGEEVWFLLTDMVKILGYVNTSNAVRLLKEHQYRTATEEERKEIGQHSGRAPYFITEGGFYRLALRSIRPEAEAFQDWVEEEVLPAIRREGGYISQNATQEQIKALTEKYQARLDSVVDKFKLKQAATDNEVEIYRERKKEELDSLMKHATALERYKDYLHYCIKDKTPFNEVASLAEWKKHYGY